MKKTTSLILFTLCLMLSTHAWAITGFSSQFTNAAGDTTPYSGQLADTPYLHLTIDGLAPNESFTLSSFWFDGTSATANMYFAQTPQAISGTNEVWLALTDSFTNSLYNWADAGVGKDGDWLIRSNVFTSLGDAATFTRTLSVGSGTGTVVPEPFSTALFLFGSVPLAAGLYRKRKK